MGASASMISQAGTPEFQAEIQEEYEKLKGEGLTEEDIEAKMKEKYAEQIAALSAAAAAPAEEEGEVAAPTADADADLAAAATDPLSVTDGDELEKKTIDLTALQIEIDAAVANGKTPLIVDNSEEDKVNTFFQYGSGKMIDGKKMGLDKTMKKIPVADIMEDARANLSSCLKLGVPLYIAMTKSMTDFKSTFTDTVAKANHGLGDGMFLPIEMFDKAGKGLLEEEYLNGIMRESERDQGFAVCRDPDGFYIVLTTQFSPEDFEEFLFSDEYGLPTPKAKYVALIIATPENAE